MTNAEEIGYPKNALKTEVIPIINVCVKGSVVILLHKNPI